jgi:hypothetical protein
MIEIIPFFEPLLTHLTCSLSSFSGLQVRINVQTKGSFDMSCKEADKYLREGWYGSNDDNNNNKAYDNIIKKPVDCDKLLCHCIDVAKTKFIPICAGDFWDNEQFGR